MNPWIDIAGWTLVHFVWEGAAIGAIAVLGLGALRGGSPQARYLVACAALAGMLIAPALTARALLDASRASRPAAGALRDSSQAAALPAPRTGSAARNAPPPSIPAGTSSAGRDAAPSSFSSWLPGLVALWMAGVLLLLGRTIGGWIRVRRLHRTSILDAPSRWEPAARRVASVLGLRRLVLVIDSALVDTPTVIGWLRPVILLPIGAIANLSPAQVEAVLAHELAHIRRHDFLVNTLQAFAETVLFYHPAVWWLSARIRAEREHCCDRVAVEVCGDAVSYAEALAELESWRTVVPALAVAATGGPLIERIRRLLGTPRDDIRIFPSAMTVAAVTALVVLSIGATQLLRAAQPGIDQGVETTARGSVDAVAWRMVVNDGTSELNIIGYTARDLIRYANQNPRARVVGGPRWLDDETFRIVVNLAAPPSADEMPSLVRRVLEERFQLRTHIETRDFPAYALVMARTDKAPGPNLRVSTVDCFDLQAWIDAGQPTREIRRGAERQPVCGEQDWNSTIARTSYTAITMPQFAESMRGFSRVLAAGSGDWPDGPDVVDRTGLRGRFDVDLHALLPAAALMGRFPLFKVLLEPLGVPSMDRALEEQLGLKLEPSTAPYDVIVIDDAERPGPP